MASANFCVGGVEVGQALSDRVEFFARRIQLVLLGERLWVSELVNVVDGLLIVGDVSAGLVDAVRGCAHRIF